MSFVDNCILSFGMCEGNGKINEVNKEMTCQPQKKLSQDMTNTSTQGE